LSDTGPGQSSSPTRTVPVYSVDLSTVLERRTQRFGDWLQTLEPRLQYVKIPFRNQDDLPVFDTIDPDFNLVQLFRRNRFTGYDRVGDTNQLNVGVTTRIIDATDGSQLLTATVGQSRYFSDRRVTLPGDALPSGDASNYVAEIGFHVQNRWNVGLGYQWNTDVGASQLAEARLQYRQDAFRAINLAYRYRRDVLNEVDLSAAWPISESWSAIGRYQYSILENQALEGLLGVEYQTCCWGLRLTLRRHLADREGRSDTSVSLQLVLKGLGNPLEPAERLLERGILGYERD
jgi:LPS-assembly protein